MIYGWTHFGTSERARRAAFQLKVILGLGSSYDLEQRLMNRTPFGTLGILFSRGIGG